VLPEWLLADTIAGGQLVQLLPDWSIPSADVNVVFPASRHLPGRVRAFVDFAITNLPVLLAETSPATAARRRLK